MEALYCTNPAWLHVMFAKGHGEMLLLIVWIFVRDGDLDSIKSNVLPLHATVHTSRKALFVPAV